MTVMKRRVFLSLVVLAALLSAPLMLPVLAHAASSASDTTGASVTIQDCVTVMFAVQQSSYGGGQEYPLPGDLSPLDDCHWDVHYSDLVAGHTNGADGHPGGGSSQSGPFGGYMTRHGTLHGWRNSVNPFHMHIQYEDGYGGTFAGAGIELYMRADSFETMLVSTSPSSVAFWGGDGPHGAAPLYWQCVFPNGINTPSGTFQETVRVDIFLGS